MTVPQSSSRTMLVVLLVSALVGGGLGALAYAQRTGSEVSGLPGGDNPTAEPTATATRDREEPPLLPDRGRRHVAGQVSYPGEDDTPPTSGDHASVAQSCQVYDEPIANQHAVHSLEHGAVWITYDPDEVSARELAELERLVEGESHRMLSPYPGLRSAVSAQAWRTQIFADGAFDPDIEEFADTFTEGDRTPERGAACLGTTDTVNTLTTPAAGICSYAPQGQAARPVRGVPSATARPAPGARALLRTNRGIVGITFSSKAPCTVNSFLFLAQQKYFDSSPCHRLTTAGIFVLQCGDPSGTGGGGPGYRFADENLTGATYPRGTVAMANSGPGTNGSQFFLVYKDTQLPPSYTPFGTITSGLDVLDKVAAGGTTSTTGDGRPRLGVTLTTVPVAAGG